MFCFTMHACKDFSFVHIIYKDLFTNILTFIIALFIIVKTYKELSGKSTKKQKKTR